VRRERDEISCWRREEEGREGKGEEGVEELTETETVSFSLTMGTTPIESNSVKVLTALRYRVR